MRVLLDTSFILNALKYKALDLLEIRTIVPGAKLEIPSAVASELGKLGKKSELDYLVKNGAKILPGKARYADKEILEIVGKAGERLVVATQDGGLTGKLKTFKPKCGVLFVRGKKKLALEGGA